MSTSQLKPPVTGTSDAETAQKHPAGALRWLWHSRLPYAVGITLLFLLFLGQSVPFSNEFFYLLTPLHQWRPSFLARDFAFSAPSESHFVFNLVAGLPMLIAGPVVVGWIGRIAGWLLLALGLIRIGDSLQIPRWASSLSILLWIAIGQDIVGGAWMFRGFEAKVIAYVLLLYSLAWFVEGKDRRAWIALGLCIDFHAAVGVAAFPAVVLALLLTDYGWRRTLRWGILALIIALPSLLPAFLMPSGGAAEREAWHFVTVTVEPAVLNPLYFKRRELLLLTCMLGYVLVRAIIDWNDKTVRFYAGLLAGMACVFAFGVVARLSGRYELLRITPFRLLPLFTAILFLFMVFHGEAVAARRPMWLKAWAVVTLMMVANPVGKAFDWAHWLRTGESPVSANDDIAANFRWIARNTPNDALIVAPPWRKDEWFRGRRAQIADWWVPVYERLPEWRDRILSLTGSELDKRTKNYGSAVDAMESYYNTMPIDSVLAIQKRYGGDYLVTAGHYSFTPLFRSGKYTTYRLPAH